MNELDRAREKINAIDKQIAKLFEERMHAAYDVAMYKKTHSLPIFDGNREQQVIEKNSAYIEDGQIKSLYILLQKELISLSKKYQEGVMGGMQVAYSGVEGAYAHTAATRVFPDMNYIPFHGFAAAYSAVENGDCSCAVLPIENSSAGEVGDTLDLIYSGSLYVNGIYELKVTHNLLAPKGTKLSDITTVISHPQALEQCRTFIERGNFKTVSATSTSSAAKQVASLCDGCTAAIADKKNAALYGLDILAQSINDNAYNTTRFAVLSRAYTPVSSDVGLFYLGFTVNHEAGALAKAINIIADNGFNMHSIKSRALKDTLWQYVFFTEIQGDPDSENGKKMLGELHGICNDVKVLGAFKEHVLLED